MNMVKTAFLFYKKKKTQSASPQMFSFEKKENLGKEKKVY